MTTVTFISAGADISNFVQQVDIWRESLLGVGRFEILLDPNNALWSGVFTVGGTAVISIDGVIMMEGYVDDVKAVRDKRGTDTWRWKLPGRDYGFDLAELYESVNYENTRGDDIAQNVLATAGSEITFASPSVATQVNYRFDRTYLSDGLRDIAKEIGYDFYVENTKVAGNAILHFFPVGSGFENSGVALTSIAGSTTNNILNPLEIGESIGSSMKNNVELIAGPLRDHWTEFNASDYTPNASTVVADDINPLAVLHGRGSIVMTNIDGLRIMEANMIFPLYDHTVLDLSERSEGVYRFRPAMVNAGGLVSCKIQLTDINGDQIEFYRSAWGGPVYYNCTDAANNIDWREVKFWYGDGVEINPWFAGSVDDTWQYVAPSGAFDWSNVVGIGFHNNGSAAHNTNDHIWIDGLEIPTVEVRSIEIDAFSDALYRTRMIPYYRPDIRSQVELNATAVYELARNKEIVESIPNVLCIGQTGTPYPGQTLTVQISDHIPLATDYRIFSLHHQVVKSSNDSPYPGYTFTTEYNLIKHMIGSSVQYISPERIIFDRYPQKGITQSWRHEFASQKRRR